MFLFDLRDFREHSSIPVNVTEEKVLAALEEAGLEFKTPLSVRFRIKDMDTRLLRVKADLVDNVGDEFRLNIYVPPVGPQKPPPKVWEMFCEGMNAQIRHQLAHIVQTRRPGGLQEQTREQMLEHETEANMLALEGKCNIVS